MFGKKYRAKRGSMTKERLNKIIVDAHVKGSVSSNVDGRWFVLIRKAVAQKLPHYIDLEDGTEVAVVYSDLLDKYALCIPDKPGDKSNIVFY